MGREHLGRFGWRFAFQSMPSRAKTPVAREYAKYKNPPYPFHDRGIIYRDELRTPYVETAMTDDPAPGPAASTPENKRLTPAAQRALAEAEARRKAAEANAK